MSNKQLKIIGAVIRRATPVSEAEAAAGAKEHQQLIVEVDNPSDKALHVWASRSAYDYDSSTHVLYHVPH